MSLTHDPGQGSNSKYQGGCRCPECRAAHAQALRLWRWLRKVAQRLSEIEAEMRDYGTFLKEPGQ
jgi:hypothetical protein